MKEKRKHLGGLLQPISIPEWKWEVISMDFITGLSRIVRQHDSIMVMVDRLTKVVYFILVKSTFSSSNVAQIFIKYVVRLHGVPKTIVSERDEKFTLLQGNIVSIETASPTKMGSYIRNKQ